MPAKLLITFAALVWGVGVPILEINDTHVFNPDWTPHALIHEVWQLFTNTILGFVCIWLAWGRDDSRLAAVLGLTITGGFMVAFLIRNTYGGSMKYLDGSEKTVAGMNLGVLGFSIVIACLCLAFLLDHKGHVSVKT
ncbi:MAG: hypothetical protein RLN89_03075 [Parvibaculum sp.]